MSELPNHRRADIKDGMDPEIVSSVYCTRCEAWVGRWKDLAQIEDFDEDTIECEDCLNGGEHHGRK